MPAPLDTSDGYRAVVDIGSNSVRLVVFDGYKRVPDTIFNEKILCGLGADLGTTGRLAEGAVETAVSTLKRFRALINQMNVADVDTVATAAVRDAENGADFIRQVHQSAGLDIRTVSGEEEGRLSALGVLSGEPGATGLVGDLGGGSLELVRVGGGVVKDSVSLPLGPLRVQALSGGDRAAAKDYIRNQLQAVPWINKERGRSLYLVGGAWRNLGKLFQRDAVTPLRILQGFRVDRSSMASYAKRLSRLDADDIPYGSTIPGRRREILPMASLVLREVLRASKVDQAVFSSFGLREGLLFDALPADERAKDPFLFSCRNLARERSRFAEHSSVLMDWTRPLFPATETGVDNSRLHMAVCLLSDIAWRGHPDYRAEKAVEAVLHGHFVGVTHRERAFVAVALNQIYGAPIDVPEIAPILSILKLSDIREARTLGSALRLAQRLSGGAVSALEVSSLDLSRGTVRLHLPQSMRDLANEVVIRRLKQLGQLIGSNIEILYE